MVAERSLPKKRNPLLAADRAPTHDDLVSRRRLGQTTLAVKATQVGTMSATKPENLGLFEYAHLRAPLPDNLKGSEIFAPNSKVPHTEAYFLMRRSSDGFVSATGMFKASFPWARVAEEQAERDYIKGLSTTSNDEVAGNIWIPESFALKLAEEYGIVNWIAALLDSSPVSVDDQKKTISPPPKYIFTANEKTRLPPPVSTPSRGRGRPRAGSPAKATPGGKVTSPRKRPTKASKETNAAAARQASESLQATLESAASITGSESVEPPSLTSDRLTEEGEKAIVSVKSAVEVNGDTETVHTDVQVKMPAGSPDLPLPESTEEMVSKAKEMVEEARKIDGESPKSGGKRKANALEDEADAQEATGEGLQVSKRAKLTQEVRTQKVRNRALVGIAATLAAGALLPYVLGA